MMAKSHIDTVTGASHCSLLLPLLSQLRRYRKRQKKWNLPYSVEFERQKLVHIFEKISHAVLTFMRSQYRYCTRTSTNISEYEGTKKLSPFFLLIKWITNVLEPYFIPLRVECTCSMVQNNCRNEYWGLIVRIVRLFALRVMVQIGREYS
jgi:hypothetical protein